MKSKISIPSDTSDLIHISQNCGESACVVIEIIKYYKNKACEVIGNKCEKCEAAFEYNGKLWCAFDTVNRFIKWDNVYNK